MKVKNKVPTFEEAVEITKQNPCFTHRYREVDGVKVSIFDYLLASYKDFAKPIEGSDLAAFELRGLCFTHNEDMSIHRRYVMLHKFFNVNQTEDSQFHKLKKKKIVKIMDKMDGSVMRFIRLPNGKAVVKSKTFFDNDQTTMATQYYKSKPNLQAFVEESLDQGLAGIFELTGPFNRIVCVYDETKLTLLQLRDESTGEYLDVHNHPLVLKHKIDVVEDETYKYIKKDETKTLFEKISSLFKKLTLSKENELSTLFDLKKVITNKEGWIVQMDDFYKVKGDEYCEKHGLVDAMQKEDKIMEFIIKGTIDDVIVTLDERDPRRKNIEVITTAYAHYMSNLITECLAFAKEYKGDRKAWAKEYLKHRLFHLTSGILDVQDEALREEKLTASLKEKVLKDTYFLNKAKKFVTEELKVPLLMQFEMDDA